MGPKEKDDDLGDVYSLLGIEEDAGDKEIQGAYRKASRKWHPDKNPDNPDAAEMFDKLTRAKELLLDPIRRSDLDRKRKAAHDLEARHAEEDSKRRKMREDLESREAAADKRSEAARSAAEQAAARKKHIQQDFAARIKAREDELSGRNQEVAAEVAEARNNALEARICLKWKGKPPSIETVQKELSSFDVKSMEIAETSAIIQLGCREDAIQAVLYGRQRKANLPFRIEMATDASKKDSEPANGKQKAPKAPAAPTSGKTRGDAPSSKAASPGSDSGKPAGGATNFDDWEAQMLAEMASLAAKQKKA